MRSTLKNKRIDKQEEEKKDRKIKDIGKKKTWLSGESREKKQIDVHTTEIIWDEEQDLIWDKSLSRHFKLTILDSSFLDHIFNPLYQDLFKKQTKRKLFF